MEIERRTFDGLEIRAGEDNGEPTIDGIAAVTGRWTKIRGWFGEFEESIAPGAFKRAIEENQDVRGLFNHDPNLIFARTGENLTLEENDKGLRYIATDLPDTQEARDLLEKVRRRLVTQSSFAFRVKGEKWEEGDEDTPDRRTITDLDLFDVSPVTYPAYTDTEVGVRSSGEHYEAWKKGREAEAAEAKAKASAATRDRQDQLQRQKAAEADL